MIVETTMDYYFPIVSQNALSSNFLVGSIIGLSNLAALFCDLLFPQLFRKKSWKFFLVVGMILQFAFPGFTNIGIVLNISVLFLLAALFWNIYYEFISFARNNFIVTNQEKEDYSKDWGMVAVIICLTSVIGPVLGSALLKTTTLNISAVFTSLELIAVFLVIILVFTIPNKSKQENELHSLINLLKEFSFVEAIGLRIFPVIIMGILFSFIEGCVLTVGGLLGEKFLGTQGLDWLIIFSFSLPGIIGSLLLTRFKIKTHKKRFSHIALLLGTIPLILISLFRDTPLLIVLMFFISGLFIYAVWVFNEAIYSDLAARAGKSKLHFNGMERITESLGLLIGSMLIGFLSDKTDYLTAFSIIGIVCLVIAILLILITPKKLKLPQHKLLELENSLGV